MSKAQLFLRGLCVASGLMIGGTVFASGFNSILCVNMAKQTKVTSCSEKTLKTYRTCVKGNEIAPGFSSQTVGTPAAFAAQITVSQTQFDQLLKNQNQCALLVASS